MDDDGRWELGPNRVIEGRGEIVAHWRTSLDAYQHVVQLYLSNTVTVDGDDAAGRAYLIELNVPVSGPRRMFVGWYDDGYRRTADGWRFTRRALTRLYSGKLISQAIQHVLGTDRPGCQLPQSDSLMPIRRRPGNLLSIEADAAIGTISMTTRHPSRDDRRRPCDGQRSRAAEGC